MSLLLHHPTRVLWVLSAHGPWAFGVAFAVGLNCVNLFVIGSYVNGAV